MGTTPCREEINFCLSVMFGGASGTEGSYEALDGGVMAPGGDENAFGEGPGYTQGPSEAPCPTPPPRLEPP